MTMNKMIQKKINNKQKILKIMTKNKIDNIKKKYLYYKIKKLQKEHHKQMIMRKQTKNPKVNHIFYSNFEI